VLLQVLLAIILATFSCLLIIPTTFIGRQCGRLAVTVDSGYTLVVI
jgi:hypothetical protein